MEQFKFLEKNKVSQLPKTAGVYAFKKGQNLLYIGKAVNIKERVKQHRELINLATKAGYIKTDSEIEALILEANLIKTYQPKYNVVWRDDKNYFYVAATREAFPKIFLTHQPKLKSKKIPSSPPSFSLRENSVIDYVGPFVDGKALKQTLKVLRKVFPYRSCNKIPKHPCLWYQLNLCPAPCLLRSTLAKQIYWFTKSIIERESKKNTKNLLKILRGKKSQAIIDLKKEMKKASKSEDYERAAKIRDQIRSLEKVIYHAKIFQPEWNFKRIEAYDISNIQGKMATGSMVVFTDGQPDKSQYRKFKIKIAGKPNDTAMLKEVLKRRLKHKEWPLSDLILIDGGRAQLNAAKAVVKNKIKVMAIAKKRNELYMEEKEKPVLLKKLPREVFNLILQLRDEAHRFAISYHRKLREKDLLEK